MRLRTRRIRVWLSQAPCASSCRPGEFIIMFTEHRPRPGMMLVPGAEGHHKGGRKPHHCAG
ncbi:hypothetical protein E2I00_010312 [Balaenoptera physalus]|uniref:Uncharacterized protein n=1 Tax=Balaenoptera physalus TaxID=9770 RepID=A0A643C9I7_BALPH|nr:hypothetical protein E2I00_010312 [Balaenoptera physalus]